MMRRAARHLNRDLDAARGFVVGFFMSACIWALLIMGWFYVLVPQLTA